MGFRFHRAFQLLPGVRLNISKTGLSLSIGGAPVTLNWSRRGLKFTGSAPGTGLSYSDTMRSSDRNKRTGAPRRRRPLA